MDKEFLDRLKAGDAGAFDAMVLEFQVRVTAVCRRFLRNPEDAEDTAQEVFVEVYKALPGFREEAEFSTWIYRIAVTKSLDVLRKKGRKKRGPAGRAAAAGGDALDAVAGDPADDPGRRLEARERSRLLDEALAALSDKQRTAIILSRFEGLSHKDIAAILGTTTDSVESLVFRAQANLRKRLRRYYGRRVPGEDK